MQDKSLAPALQGEIYALRLICAHLAIALGDLYRETSADRDKPFLGKHAQTISNNMLWSNARSDKASELGLDNLDSLAFIKAFDETAKKYRDGLLATQKGKPPPELCM